jgi:hypothetical protein
MPIVKYLCDYCHAYHDAPPSQVHRDWEHHPSWIAGMESLNAYSGWVSSVVLPIAFQWIEEHRAEVYANIPDGLKDDVGVVIAAAFKLIKELPAYQNGIQRSAEYSAAMTADNADSSKINPVWTGITTKIRAETEQAFAEQSALLGDQQD